MAFIFSWGMAEGGGGWFVWETGRGSKLNIQIGFHCFFLWLFFRILVAIVVLSYRGRGGEVIILSLDWDFLIVRNGMMYTLHLRRRAREGGVYPTAPVPGDNEWRF